MLASAAMISRLAAWPVARTAIGIGCAGNVATTLVLRTPRSSMVTAPLALSTKR